jgi:hypothetical protein
VLAFLSDTEHLMSPAVFRFFAFLARRITRRYQICEEQPIESPAVYLVHHQNLRGPVLTMLWFKKTLRPWVLSVFCDRAACFKQYYDYTFTKRMGYPRLLARILAWLSSRWVSGMMPQLRAIPVFRGSKAIIRTFRQSLAALLAGEDLLICPDIDYTDKNPAMGDMYRGFLLLDRFFQRTTGRHLAFVPLHISVKPRCIHVGRPVAFPADKPYREEQTNVYDQIVREFQRLEAQSAIR